mmetsp:Transcript_4042/g.3939  ORF Transcript_4042/g.3939 Transcript_4042/m.3939 type:complete len:85 (+) Transcript_4042:1266-1520(+)
MSVIKFGSGGDNQDHVKFPKTKAQTQPIPPQKSVIAKNELETIIEKAKEDDIPNQSLQIGNKMDPEESYSFSLRTFQAKNVNSS